MSTEHLDADLAADEILDDEVRWRAHPEVTDVGGVPAFGLYFLRKIPDGECFDGSLSVGVSRPSPDDGSVVLSYTGDSEARLVNVLLDPESARKLAKLLEKAANGADAAMSEDDIAFIQGYADAIGWMPSARPEELADIVHLSCDPSFFFEMDETHSLAKYNGWTNHGTDGITGIFVAERDDHGTEIGYTAGINAALRIHRPDVVREARARAARFKADMAAKYGGN